MKEKIKNIITSKHIDYFMACILTAVVMLTVYNISTRYFAEGSMWVIYLMMLIFAVLTAGACIWIIALTERVDELEEEVRTLKALF